MIQKQLPKRKSNFLVVLFFAFSVAEKFCLFHFINILWSANGCATL